MVCAIKKTGVLSLLVLLAVAAIAEAQQPKKVPLIGFLGGPSLASIKSLADAFVRGLRELGYVEGQNLAIEWRSAEGVNERLPNLAAELVKLKVDVIVTRGTPATQAAKNATQKIPIVMTGGSDPLGTGLVTSLARPKISGQPFIVLRYSFSNERNQRVSDRQVFRGMFYKMIRLSQVGQVVESREIAASKTCKNRIAINIASSVGFKIVY